MKIRLISDLHLDVNREYEIKLDSSKCDYTLIAGDIGGDYKANCEWIRHNVPKGAFVSGNHDAYTPDKTPLEDVKGFYHEKFPLDSEVTYFDDSVGVISKELDEKTLLIADVLYTDYKLKLSWMKDRSIKRIIQINKHMAAPKFSGSYMNDFTFFTRNPKYNRKPGDDSVGYLSPDNYEEHFNSSFKRITELVETNKDKNIILMTHHGLSRKCIDEAYRHDDLNASYTSPKDSWIRKHPNIKLILSGHTHAPKTFKVGSTLYVMNPLGYINHGQYKSFPKEGKDEVRYWTPDLFVNTDTWELTREENVPTDWNEKYEKRLAKEMAFYSCFI